MTELDGSSPEQIAAAVRQAAAREGFADCRIAPAVASEGFDELVQWIDAGYAAEMHYFRERLDAYRHPDGVLTGARSVLVMAWPYDPRPPTGRSPEPSGRIARYTSPAIESPAISQNDSHGSPGPDYHDVIHPKLKRICRLIRSLRPEAQARGVVDTAPLMEREVAQLAGLGWRGKNTLLLNRSMGSYFLIACVLTDLVLPYDDPHTTSHCGTCTACLDACPTDAFVAPHVLDASRCISYLTIENRDAIPSSLRHGVGQWLFGCDVCQEVCPWNRKPTRAVGGHAEATVGLAKAHPTTAGQADPPSSRRGWMDLLSLFELDDDAFRERFRKTPMWRSRRRGLLRNAAIVLGNLKESAALPALQKATTDDDPIVREAAVWAIDQYE